MITKTAVDTKSTISILREIREKFSADICQMTFEEQKKFMQDPLNRNMKVSILKPHLTKILISN